jgi:hypothetical protein
MASASRERRWRQDFPGKNSLLSCCDGGPIYLQKVAIQNRAIPL